MFWILVAALTYEDDNYTASVMHLSKEHASFSTKDACEKFMITKIDREATATKHGDRLLITFDRDTYKNTLQCISVDPQIVE